MKGIDPFHVAWAMKLPSPKRIKNGIQLQYEREFRKRRNLLLYIFELVSLYCFYIFQPTSFSIWNRILKIPILWFEDWPSEPCLTLKSTKLARLWQDPSENASRWIFSLFLLLLFLLAPQHFLYLTCFPPPPFFCSIEKDSDPYVRKTAALCVGKLYKHEPEVAEDEGFVDMLIEMTNDSNTAVLANALATLAEIDQMKEEGINLTLDFPLVMKFLTAINESSE